MQWNAHAGVLETVDSELETASFVVLFLAEHRQERVAG